MRVFGCQTCKVRTIEADMTPPPVQYKEIRVYDYLSLLGWRRQIRGILLTIDVWRIMNGETKPPVEEEMPDEKTWKRECDKWRKLQNAALGWMVLTLEDFSRQSIERFTDPLEAMEDMFKRFPPPFISFDEFRGAVPVSIAGMSVLGDPKEIMSKAKYDKLIAAAAAVTASASTSAGPSEKKKLDKGKGKAPEIPESLTDSANQAGSSKQRSKQNSHESTGGESKRSFLDKFRILRGSAEDKEVPSDKDSLTRNSALMATDDAPEAGPAPVEPEPELLKPTRYNANAYVVVPQRSASLERHDYGGDGNGTTRRHHGRGNASRPSGIRLERLEHRDHKTTRHDEKESRVDGRTTRHDARDGRTERGESRPATREGRHGYDGRESRAGGREGRSEHRPTTKTSRYNLKDNNAQASSSRDAGKYMMSGALPVNK